MTVYLQLADDAIAAERARQIEVEGFSADRDDGYRNNELSSAARAYHDQAARCRSRDAGPPTGWPWNFRWWKPQSAERNLIRAAALYQAELERIIRRDRLTSVLNNDADFAQAMRDRTAELLAMLYRDRAEQIERTAAGLVQEMSQPHQLAERGE